MANPEHLEILKQGVNVWNEWRIEYPDVLPDLREADLSKFNFWGMNLNEANLSKSNLTLANLEDTMLNRANLSEAQLTGAVLSRSYLTKANLEGADLTNTNLTHTRFSSANLNLAYLVNVDLTWAHLDFATLFYTDISGAKLNHARMMYVAFSETIFDGTILVNSSIGKTSFANVDLSTAKGLESVQHHLPSSISIDTVYKSRGKIPESFLRGCGIPEDFIKLTPSLVSQPFAYYSCFISYSSKDDDFAHRLHADLQSNKVRVWFAPEDMKIGDKIWDRLDQSIRIHDKLLLVLSEQSINSDWVEDEVTTAFEEERRRKKMVLFPIRLDDAVMDTDKPWAAKVRQRHIGDFTDWKNHDSYKKAFDRLLRDLKASEE